MTAPKKRPHQVIRFAMTFTLIYAALLLPWPGLSEGYESYFQKTGQFFLSQDTSRRLVRFEPGHLQHGHSVLRTQIIIAWRDQNNITLDEGSARVLSVDARSIGWIPLALIFSLVVATPVPWRRRAKALLLGLVGTQAFVLFSLWIWIGNESVKMGLVDIPSWFSTVLDPLQYTLIDQMGVSFAVPALVWVLVTFRCGDEMIGLTSNAVHLSGSSNSAT